MIKRHLLALLMVSASLSLTWGLTPVQGEKGEGEYFVYVGSYTAATSKGIYAWKFNPAAASLVSVGLVAETPNPAQIWIAPNGKFLYAVNWQGNDTIKGDTVSAYAINAKTGALTFL